jgi:Type II CAAX prenyl endopeptidase Rce1-like
MPIFKEIKLVLLALFRNKTAFLLLATLLLLMGYGYHGNLDLLRSIIPDYPLPGSDPAGRIKIIPFIPWDIEFISFAGGAILLVVIPCLIIKWKNQEKLSDYGLAFPEKNNRSRSWVLFLTLFLGSLVPFYFAAKNPDMQNLYPFYHSFTSLKEFIVYEISYFPFFMVIEFVFRGIILFSLLRLFSNYFQQTEASALAVVVAMLPYCVWHIGKPLTELWGTPIWGLLAGAGIIINRSIWPVLMAHWMLNIWLDAQILRDLHLAPFH